MWWHDNVSGYNITTKFEPLGEVVQGAQLRSDATLRSARRLATAKRVGNGRPAPRAATK